MKRQEFKESQLVSILSKRKAIAPQKNLPVNRLFLKPLFIIGRVITLDERLCLRKVAFTRI